jgi:hypothetical protein
MHPPEVFLERAVECERMATRDRGSRAAWRGMAERWHRVSEQTRHRPSPGWARH